MHIVLWDTSCNDVQKDFAGGMGVGMHSSGRSVRSRLIGMSFRRDRRPVAMNFAYMAGIFKRLGHTVQYVVDRDPPAADLYVFNPALASLEAERDMMRRVQER